MKSGRAASIGLGLLLVSLLALITWFLALSLDPAASRYDRSLGVLDNFEMTESILRRNILSVRIGLLRDYDPLVQETNTLASDLDALRTLGVRPAVIDPLAALVAQQDGLVEQFKTDNALLQNALSHFMVLSGQLDISGQDRPLAQSLTTLLVELLHFTFDMSPAAAEQVTEGLDGLTMQASAASDPDLVKALLAQVHELHNILPETGGVVRTLYELPRAQREKAVRDDIVEHQEAARNTARLYRCFLYIVSLLLLGLLIHLGLQLHRRMLTQQRRAAYERTIAEISMRFVSAPSDKIHELVEQALADLAAWVHADRAYFLALGTHGQRYTWHADGITFPANWPERALTLTSCLGGAKDTAVHIPRIGRLPADASKDTLVEAGLRGWICISAGGPENTRSVLGFDALHRPMAMQADEMALLGMAFDVVANAVSRDSLQRERERLEATLQQARRMETVGALASGVAHNFNNIIGAILGHAEMAESQVPPGSQASRNLEVIRQASERARDLVDQILAFGHRRDPVRRPVPVKSLLKETESLLTLGMQPRTNLVFGEVPMAAIVSGEAAQLQQVIVNLCNNAAQSMDGNGTVEVRAEIRNIAKKCQFAYGSLGPNAYVCIAVSDAGRGIDNRMLQQIFEPFFTTRSNGNGLGLATVRAIVSEHGGAVTVTSTLGKGSIFEVWLPLVPVNVDDCSTTSLEYLRGHGETIMLIDDIISQRFRNEEIIAALGYEPVGFANADEALAACRGAPDRFDAVVISHLTPAGKALELAVKLHEHAPHLPILLMAPADEISADMLTSAGIREIIACFATSGELASALHRCLAAGLEADMEASSKAPFG
jgi:signal transduction histidine kinase